MALTNGKQLGNDCIISFKNTSGNWYSIGAGKGCSLDASLKLIEVSDPTTGTSKAHVPGKDEWKMSSSNFYTSQFGLLMNKFRNHERIKIAMHDLDRLDYDTMFYGYAYITRIKKTANISNLSVVEITFTGDGPLLTNEDFTAFPPEF